MRNILALQLKLYNSFNYTFFHAHGHNIMYSTLHPYKVLLTLIIIKNLALSLEVGSSELQHAVMGQTWG